MAQIASDLKAWKDKAIRFEKQSEELLVENAFLKRQNGENEALKLENESLREQIKEMIVSNDEAIKRQQAIAVENDKRSSMSISKMKENKLQKIDDENGKSDFEETAAALSTIRSQMCKPDKISKHESAHSMTAIVDLVKKTKSNMESQSFALSLLNDNDASSEESSSSILSCDDSFSDHLGLIETMLTATKGGLENDDTKGNDDEHVFETLDISKIDTFEMLNGSNSHSHDDADEPPLFWTNDGMNDEDLQRMIADPNQILDDVVMSPVMNESLSDWDDLDIDVDDSSESPKVHKKIKKKRKKKKKPNKRKKKKQTPKDDTYLD